MKRLVVRALSIGIALALALVASRAHAEIRVGSKRFVESYVLGEIVAQAARAAGGTAKHEQGLGGTAVTFRALTEGSIDVYPEYTGTLAETGAAPGTKPDLASLRDALGKKGLAVSDPLGFENTYALAVTRATATRLGVKSLSDLATKPGLRFALSHEFVGRSDGWSGLAKHYDLHASVQTSIDHALGYEAIVRGDTDVTDVYTTDAKIARFDLVVLSDDKKYFPPYEAVLVYRADLATREPAFAKVLEKMRGAIDAPAMQKLNARVDLDGLTPVAAAAEHLAGKIAEGANRAATMRPGVVAGTIDSIAKHGPRHLWLVLVSVMLSALVGVPLGVLAFANERLGTAVLGITGIVQTIPSLALFCFMIPLLGIGALPALVALFLYGLLPIVRNTHAGLSSIPRDLREAALALGLSPGERLRHVELPLASRTILAGIKTSAVVAVGSATIAAFIGAGGFGDPISTGLSLNDVPMILTGAIPAALLAILVELAFVGLERPLVPKT